MPVSIPKSFPAGTQFGEFEGIPVSQDADRNATAWDVAGGRRFLSEALRPFSCSSRKPNSERS
jgi:hypothetical protein